MDHNSIMPFGKFKGTPLKDIPAWYLMALYHKQIKYRSYGKMADVLVYVNDNYEKLKNDIL